MSSVGVPVQLVITPDAGVPSNGAVRVGEPVQLVITSAGLPVQLLITPLVGVPNAGVTSAGDVERTSVPVPLPV